MMPSYNYPPAAPIMQQQQQQQQFLPVPYVAAVPLVAHGVIKRRVTVVGTVPPTSTRFSVNLQCGPNTHPVRDDIALHLQFRFDAQVPYVSRNHLALQTWGVEEAHGYLSFGRGQPFVLHVDTEHDHFKIYLNDLHFTDFRHRLPVQRIAYLTIDGDVFLSAVRFDGQPLTMTSTYNQPLGFVNPMPGGTGAGSHFNPAMQAGTALLNPMAMSHMAPAGYPAPGHSTAGGYHATSHAIPVAAAGVGTGLVAGALMHGANKKMMKKQKKMMKKAMKPHKFSHKLKHKHFHHGFHGHHRSGGSSSSSSSSSS